MAKRSLQSSPKGIVKIKQAMARKGWTQDYLASQAGLSTRNSVWKFISGRGIDRQIFMELCFQLDLDWQEIANLPQDLSLPTTSSSQLTNNANLDEVVQTLRSRLNNQIQAQCSQLHSFLDMTRPVLLEKVYTNLSVLPYLSHQRWLEVSDLYGKSTDFNRFSLNPIESKTIPLIELVASHSKLVILGKPGSGKTTFLQYLALQCQARKYKGDCIPVFITLRTLAASGKTLEDFNLLNYISSSWNNHDISSEQVETLLQQGKLLLLLNGLDEIPQSNSEEIIQQIQQFAETYAQNQIIITCRLAAQTYHFSGFTYFEIADLDSPQIETFAKKWFSTNNTSNHEGLKKATLFLDLLKRQENKLIRELASTPILLNLLCLVFQEKAQFPNKHWKLYQEGLEILLSKWDLSRGIKREHIYSNLSLSDKLKLLGEIASTTFERGNYFFEKTEVLQIISDYLLTLPNVSYSPEELLLDSEGILKGIEVQHGLLVERAKGIYSFSHLTFQEYLIARKLVAKANLETFKYLAVHITKPRWREVILLTVSMLPNVSFLFQEMEIVINSLWQNEPQLQKFIHCIDKKVDSIQSSYDSLAMRAFYFSLFYNQDFNLAISLDNQLASNLSGDLGLDLALSRAFTISLTLLDNPVIPKILDLIFALDLERSFQLTPEFTYALQSLKQTLPELSEGKENLIAWWLENGRVWVENFRNILLEHRSIGYNWHFNQLQHNSLKLYYSTSQFLVELKRII